jgi:hypothetical protein
MGKTSEPPQQPNFLGKKRKEKGSAVSYNMKRGQVSFSWHAVSVGVNEEAKPSET